MRGSLLTFILCAGMLTYGQDVPIDLTKNTLQNPQNLKEFYKKLAKAKKGKSSIAILHIGDSHIQAGFFTGALRDAFQRDYGNAGRGLLFPYRLANTNGHMDARFSSDVAWQRYRIITEDAPRAGIAGATVYSEAAQFSVQLRCEEAFNQISIYGKGLGQLRLAIPKERGKRIAPQVRRQIHVVRAGEVLGKISRKYGVSIRQLKQWNRIKGTMIRIGQKLLIEKRNKMPAYHSEDFTWIQPYEQTETSLKATLTNSTTELYLIKQPQGENKTVSLYSFHLSNSQQGVTYNGVGYNGAKYADYLRSPLFFRQLEERTHPDLIIVSLGTNEAFDKVQALESFHEEVVLFCKELELRTGCKNIVLTTPPSALRKRKYPNEKLAAYAQILEKIAQERAYAVWDLYEIMGGKEGMKDWYKNGLAGRDRIHFKKEGYALQGKLLYEALMQYSE